MAPKTKNIINWVLAGLIGLIFIGSGAGKMLAGEQTIKMAQDFGISVQAITLLGAIEIISALLFIYPRTGMVGTLLLVAYMGGAIATHLQQGQPLIVPMVIETFIWIAAIIRFPELSTGLMGRN